MTKADQKKVDELVHRLSLKYNLSNSIIREIIESPYLYTKIALAEINPEIEKAITEDDAEKLKTTFLYKSFFKLYISKYRLLKRNQQRKIINELNNSRWKK